MLIDGCDKRDPCAIIERIKIIRSIAVKSNTELLKRVEKAFEKEKKDE